MSIAIQRLHDGLRPTLTAHFLSLSMMDRSLRFGTPLTPPVIAAYVDKIDFARDAVFGIQDRHALVGAAHVALEGDSAELGLSVLPMHRGRGLGGALFQHAMAHARDRCISRLIMHFLWGNAPIMRIARRFRMNIVANAHEVHAQLDLPPASLASRAREFVTDAYTLCGRAQNALTAAWTDRPTARGDAGNGKP